VVSIVKRKARVIMNIDINLIPLKKMIPLNPNELTEYIQTIMNWFNVDLNLEGDSGRWQINIENSLGDPETPRNRLFVSKSLIFLYLNIGTNQTNKTELIDEINRRYLADVMSTEITIHNQYLTLAYHPGGENMSVLKQR